MMQELMANFNADLLKEVNQPRVVKTGTYTGQVLEVETRTNPKTEVQSLSLTVQLFDDGFAKVGRTYIEITPTELRNRAGKLTKASELFYALYKVMGAESPEEFVSALTGFVFTCYGSENYQGRNQAFPVSLQDATALPDAWQTVFVNPDEDKKRELLLGAELKPRFMVLRVGAHRG